MFIVIWKARQKNFENWIECLLIFFVGLGGKPQDGDSARVADGGHERFSMAEITRRARRNGRGFGHDGFRHNGNLTGEF